MRNLIALLFLVATADAQISVKQSYEPFEPIIVGCNCVVPDGAEAQFHWTVDEDCQAIETTSNQLYVWAPPGKHLVSLLVIKQFYEEINVFVPNPDHPEDPTKAILKKVKISNGFETEKYERTYSVGEPDPGPDPEPDPDPDPDPEPEPEPTPTGEWAKIVAKAPDKSKIAEIAGNYSSIGSQMSDPARNGAYANYSACSDAVGAMHRQVLGSNFGQWGGFFSELALWQVKEIDKRKINVASNPSASDKLEIGRLFTHIGEGLQNAN